MNNNEQQIGMMPVIFQGIGLLVFGYLSFMGLNYITNGNLMLSGSITVAGIVIVYVLSYLLAYRKAKKTDRSNEKQNKTNELILLSVYAFLFLVFSVINTHSLIIDFVKKSELQQAGLAKVGNLKNMKDAYNTAIKDAQNKLKTEADGHLASFKAGNKSAFQSLEALLGKGTITPGNIKQSYSEALNKKCEYLEEKYQLNPIYTKETETYLLNAEQVFKDWKLFKTAYTYQELDLKAQEYLKKSQEKMPEFSYTSPEASKLSFSDYKGNIGAAGISTLLCLIFCLVIHYCILAPYFSSRRQEKKLIEVRRTSSGRRGIRD